ncbi:MAG: GNAT family N-acetyltransferase [Leptolyngbya sp. SIO1D8]|nr:GNAT family N-acetyltransferase [Leptolyngbya sp. SIO1D8]
MGEQIDRIETLDNEQRSEVIDVLTDAFRDHPMLPPEPTGRKSHLMAVAILDAFAGAPDATLFGISCKGELACVAFVFADGYEPGGLPLVWFLWRMLRAIGLRKFRMMGRVMSEKRGGNERRLELMLLGTRSDYQSQGLGRTMLRHLFGFARERGYASVVLETAKQTPAFGFYLREGFEVEKEISLPTMPLCMMRRPLD